MIASEILAVTLSACARDGDIDADEERRNALGDYVRAREEVRCRAKAGQLGTQDRRTQ